MNDKQTHLRGSNYVRLANATKQILFEPDQYTQFDIESPMKDIHSYGYNYVRVFLDCDTLYMSFTKNVVDFVEKAARYQTTVMLTRAYLGDIIAIRFSLIFERKGINRLPCSGGLLSCLLLTTVNKKINIPKIIILLVQFHKAIGKYIKIYNI